MLRSLLTFAGLTLPLALGACGGSSDEGAAGTGPSPTAGRGGTTGAGGTAGTSTAGVSGAAGATGGAAGASVAGKGGAAGGPAGAAGEGGAAGATGGAAGAGAAGEGGAAGATGGVAGAGVAGEGGAAGEPAGAAGEGGAAGGPSGSLCVPPPGNLLAFGTFEDGMSGNAPTQWEVRSPGQPGACAGSGAPSEHVFLTSGPPGCGGHALAIDGRGAWDCYALQRVSDYGSI